MISEKQAEINEIDKGIYNLVNSLNLHGLKTIKSCDGHGKNCAWVSISTDNIKSIEHVKNVFIIKWDLKEQSNEHNTRRN